MKIVAGNPINGGVAYGKARLVDRKKGNTVPDSAKKKGWKEFLAAKDAAAAQLRKAQAALSEKLKGQEDAGFLEIQISFLENENLLNTVKSYIEEGKDALEDRKSVV